MRLLKQDTFIKDILQLLLIGIATSALFAAGLAMATDKYFAKAITGIAGDFGQYDLLFQGRQELKAALNRQITEVVRERFPGAVLKPGISVAGKTTFFLTLPSRYKTREVYDNLGNYFDNLPGNGGFSIMTEPRINITSVPGGVFDLLSGQVAKIPGVDFTYHDGSSIGVILKSVRAAETVQKRIQQIVRKYQILEVRLKSEYTAEGLLGLGKKISQSLLTLPGVDYARDLGANANKDEYQYVSNTLQQIKKFLLAYATEVKINPGPGRILEVGDQLVAGGQSGFKKPGDLLKPLDVVIKVTAKDAAGIRGLIIEGDAGYIKDNHLYQLLPGEKIGRMVGDVTVFSRKNQLMYAMEQGVTLLKQIQGALDSYNNATGSPMLTVTEIEKVYGQLSGVKKALRVMESSVGGLQGKTNRDSLMGMVNLIGGVGDDLDYLAQTFGRIRILENRFDTALNGLGTARLFAGSSVLQNSLGLSGGILDKLHLLDSQLGIVENSLRERIRQLDDFINRLNPVVAVLLSWRNKARDFAAQIDNFGAVFTPGSENHRRLVELIDSTDTVVSAIAGVDLPKFRTGLGLISEHLFGKEQVDLNAMTAELERVKDSLPQLLDEEIGHSVDLIDKYAGGESTSGKKIQVFTTAGIDRNLAESMIRNELRLNPVSVFSLPVGTIQPDIRSEIFKVLAEVRSTIAALTVIVLWIFSFIMDQSIIIVILKQMGYSYWPAGLKAWFEAEDRPLNRMGRLVLKLLSPAYIYAGLVGWIWMAAAIVFAGARIPYLSSGQIGVCGGILGILLVFAAEKVNPVNQEEFMAGLSLGLPFRTIMREIVIPAGRPGLLQLLNRWKMIMK
jgi:hypothetical protein